MKILSLYLHAVTLCLSHTVSISILKFSSAIKEITISVFRLEIKILPLFELWYIWSNFGVTRLWCLYLLTCNVLQSVFLIYFNYDFIYIRKHPFNFRGGGWGVGLCFFRSQNLFWLRSAAEKFFVATSFFLKQVFFKA